MRVCLPAAASLATVVLVGCHSRFIETTITNKTDAAVTVVQVEYPRASFGVQRLAPGEAFHYRFKLVGQGPFKLSYFDAKVREHHQTGPELREGDEGLLQVTITAPDHADFQASLHR